MGDDLFHDLRGHRYHVGSLQEQHAVRALIRLHYTTLHYTTLHYTSIYLSIL